MGAMKTLATSIAKKYKAAAKLRTRVIDAKTQGKRELADKLQADLDRITTSIEAKKAKMLETKKPGKILTLGAKPRGAQATAKKGKEVERKAAAAKRKARQEALVDAKIDKKKRALGNIGKAHRKLLEMNYDTRRPKIVVDLDNKNYETIDELQALQAFREDPKAMRSVKLPEKPKPKPPTKPRPPTKRKTPKIVDSFNSKRGK